MVTTLVACLLALLKFCCPEQFEHFNVWTALELAIVFSFLLVYYVVPACMVLAAAHWLVVRSARSGRQVRWFGLNWLTWLAGSAVCSSFLHYSIVAAKYHECGWPLEYYYLNRFGSERWFSWPALLGDFVIWLSVLACTCFVVERWVRRVERRDFLQKRAFLFLSLDFVVVIWMSNTDRFWWVEWYEYYAWLFSTAATIYVIEVLTVRHWKAVPKFSLLAATIAGTPFWFVLSPLVPQQSLLVAGFSLVAGAFAAIAVDACFRILTHHDKGALRFVDPACGEHVASFPMWAVGIAGILGGFALIYI